jgi:hypothetical protein
MVAPIPQFWGWVAHKLYIFYNYAEAKHLQGKTWNQAFALKSQD